MPFYKILLTASYLFVIAGSGGMIAFGRKFPLARAIWQLKDTPERFIGLNGYQVWLYSWIAILIGTAGQLLAALCQS
jgi:hypothetical protein